MRAMLCPAFGAALESRDLPSPPLAPTQIRVAVAAAGVNFADTLFIAGKYQEKVEAPLIPGMELAGTVIETGEAVRDLAKGDLVMAATTGGAFADEAVVEQTDAVALPAGTNPILAAGFPVAYGTSHLGLTWKAGLQAGETLVVHGAAGGVGLTAVEIGHALGASVIATAGGPDKLAIAAEHGASHGIDSRAEDIRERVKALTGGRGADVIYDPVGGTVFDASLRCIAPDGRILLIGFASGTVPQIPANILLVKNVTVIGYWWGAYRKLAPARIQDSLRQCVTWWVEGRLRPHVSRTLPLNEAAQALDLLKSRTVTGKIVLVP